MKSKEALEILYRKDCCVHTPNESCGKCDLGKNSNCKLYNYYTLLSKDLERLEELEIVIEIVKSYLIMFNNVSFDTFITSQCTEYEEEITRKVIIEDEE